MCSSRFLWVANLLMFFCAGKPWGKAVFQSRTHPERSLGHVVHNFQISYRSGPPKGFLDDRHTETNGHVSLLHMNLSFLKAICIIILHIFLQMEWDLMHWTESIEGCNFWCHNAACAQTCSVSSRANLRIRLSTFKNRGKLKKVMSWIFKIKQ